jgi:hypothetical protein
VPKQEAKVGMTTIDLMNFILVQVNYRLCQANENHATALELCPHYVHLKCRSMFKQEVWEMFLSSEEAKSQMIEQGALNAREKLDTMPSA